MYGGLKAKIVHNQRKEQKGGGHRALEEFTDVLNETALFHTRPAIFCWLYSQALFVNWLPGKSVILIMAVFQLQPKKPGDSKRKAVQVTSNFQLKCLGFLGSVL